jgi:hypothetical protein
MIPVPPSSNRPVWVPSEAYTATRSHRAGHRGYRPSAWSTILAGGERDLRAPGSDRAHYADLFRTREPLRAQVDSSWLSHGHTQTMKRRPRARGAGKLSRRRSTTRLRSLRPRRRCAIYYRRPFCLGGVAARWSSLGFGEAVACARSAFHRAQHRDRHPLSIARLPGDAIHAPECKNPATVEGVLTIPASSWGAQKSWASGGTAQRQRHARRRGTVVRAGSAGHHDPGARREDGHQAELPVQRPARVRAGKQGHEARRRVAPQGLVL